MNLESQNSYIPHSMPTIDEYGIKSVMATLSSGFVGKGRATNQLADLISVHLSKNNTWLVNSGSSALFISLKAMDLQINDEVILSNYSCPSIYNQIINCNAKPIIVDTCVNSFFISTQDLLNKITAKTKAIIINHPFGHFDVGIFAVKEVTSIPIIEDITHSIGAKNHSGITCGSVGDITICSYGSTKFLTGGSGGSISLSNKLLAERISTILDYDYNTYKPLKNFNERYNLSLGDINSTLLYSQYEQLHDFTVKRLKIATQYSSQLLDCFPPLVDHKSVYFRFFIKGDAQHIQEKKTQLEKNNIQSAIGGTKLISSIIEQPDFQNSESLHSSILSIPIYPAMSESEVTRVINTINATEGTR